MEGEFVLVVCVDDGCVCVEDEGFAGFDAECFDGHASDVGDEGSCDLTDEPCVLGEEPPPCEPDYGGYGDEF